MYDAEIILSELEILNARCQWLSYSKELDRLKHSAEAGATTIKALLLSLSEIVSSMKELSDLALVKETQRSRG